MTMKNSLLVLIGIALFSLRCNAQGKEFKQELEFVCGSVLTTFNQEIIEYKFKSLEELNEGIEEITGEFDFEDSKKEKHCEIKIEIRIELISGIKIFLVSEIVNTSCDKELLSAAANRLKSIALATRN
jgi:hypothetical protein